MSLREISEFFDPTGEGLILLSPGSCEIDPLRLVGLECHPDDRLIRMHFNASVIDLHFHYSKKDGTNLLPSDLYQVKNLLWGASGGDRQRSDVFMHSEQFARGFAGARTGRTHARDPASTVIPIKPEDKPNPSERLREAAKAVSVESPLITAEALGKLQDQSNEFDRLSKLAKAYNNLPPVVDDDYPEMRHMYEACLRDFIAALHANGRLEGFKFS